MKKLKTGLIFSVLILLVMGFNAYSQEDAPNRMPICELRGSRIGNSVVSTPVVLPEEGVIAYVDMGVGHGFTIVQVDINGVESQVLGLDSPEQGIGKKLPAGTYKVYPDNLAGGLELGEIIVVVHIESAETHGGE